ncbi:MAG: pilin [bacterium]
MNFKKIILIWLVCAFALTPSLAFSVPATTAGSTGVPATTKDDYGLHRAANQAGLNSLAISKSEPRALIGSIIGVGLSLLGVIFFLLILYAGIKWMTAMGSSEKVEKAKEMLEAAIIGLLIVLSAYAISRFIFTNIVNNSGTGSTYTCTGTKLTCRTSCQGTEITNLSKTCATNQICCDDNDQSHDP